MWNILIKINLFILTYYLCFALFKITGGSIMKRYYRGTNVQTLPAYPNTKRTIFMEPLLQLLQSMAFVWQNHLHFAP